MCFKANQLLENMNMFVRISLILGLFAFLTSCSSGGVAQNGKNKTPITFSSNESNTSRNNIIKSDSPVKVLGAFSNYGSNGEHEWGYVVRIWKQDKNLIGMLSGTGYSRIVGDAPVAILEDVVFDAGTGKISFRASFPDSVRRFKGTLSRKKLKGEISSLQFNETEKITLLKSAETSSEMSEYASFNEWREYADRLVRLRGKSE